MSTRVAINGFGRIGRNVLRAIYESGRNDEVKVVALNDLADPETNAHLTRHDTVHGRFPGSVDVDGNDLVVDGDKIRVVAERDPSKLPWGELDVDVVLECTGLFVDRDKAALHLEAGAKKVLISAPAKGDDLTVVYGVNQDMIDPDKHQVVSNASCTTNCLAPMVKPLHEKIGVDRGLMTTIHSYTNDQVLIDVYHKDLRRARSATQSQIPTKTGAAAAVGKVLPDLDGKLDGFAVRVPTTNVSFVDLTFQASRNTTSEEIDGILKEASEGPLKGILGFSDEPLVSHDFNHDARSSIYDAPLTRMIGGDFVKVTAWYDNEWGFSHRMVDTARALMGNG